MSNLQWFFMPILGYKKTNAEDVDVRMTFGPYDSEEKLTEAIERYIKKKYGEIRYHGTGDFLIFQGCVRSFKITDTIMIEEQP